MNKKGFTLIELLAVITIIALISIIAIPNITTTTLKQKNKISEANSKILSAATDTYIENNTEKYSDSYESNGSTYCIPVQTLIDNGLLDTPFKNVNGKEIDYSNKVKATYQAEYNSFDFELVDNCEELIQYVSRPNLTDNMIPVIYSDEKNAWIKADKNSHWYNYQEKKWANAVLVKELKETNNSKSRDEYISAPPGTTILEQDILAYFTWIPRFRYQLFESNVETPINIVFENASTAKSTGTVKNQWLTHPAFTYNNQELSGIWIGKYETSIDNNNILIKNNTPIKNLDYTDANKKILEMTNDNNIYGLKKVNTHMTRNSEWGALTYLTNSIYGNKQNNTTTGNNTGIYNITGNKEFVIIDNESENSLGYALSETKKWTTNNSYPTSENVYLTRGNNSIYNYQNSKVQDGNTTFRITLTNNESQNQDYQRKYIVTLDPDGGILSETRKEVSYHEPYGNLPTPTKGGYTFMGWYGKNIFNMNEWIEAIPSVTRGTIEASNNSIAITSTGNDAYTQTYGTSDNYYRINVKPNTTYTLSWKSDNTDKMGMVYIFCNGKLDSGYMFSADDRGQKQKTFKTPSDTSFINIRLGVTPSNTTITYYDMQLEEGSNATTYEPNYITPSTIVIQDKNHTLKAAWKAN